MPKLWNETIATHRRAVRDAIVDATAALVAAHGLLSVTMSQIAEKTGIGRATLYKYFSDVEAILLAWHERHISAHLEHLAEVRDQAGDAGERLEAVLLAYAFISHGRHRHHDAEFTALLHRDKQVARAELQVHDMIRDLLIAGAKTGDIRGDVAPDELANYCLHALAAAGSLPSRTAAGGFQGIHSEKAAADSVQSKAAVGRLVAVTLAGLRPPA